MPTKHYVKIADLPDAEREARRKYMREYMRRRADDPTFKKQNADRRRARYNADPECRERHLRAVQRYVDNMTPQQQAERLMKMRVRNRRGVIKRKMTPEATARMQNRRYTPRKTPAEKRMTVHLRNVKARSQRRFKKVLQELIVRFQ